MYFIWTHCIYIWRDRFILQKFTRVNGVKFTGRRKQQISDFFCNCLFLLFCCLSPSVSYLIWSYYFWISSNPSYGQQRNHSIYRRIFSLVLYIFATFRSPVKVPWFQKDISIDEKNLSQTVTPVYIFVTSLCQH